MSLCILETATSVSWGTEAVRLSRVISIWETKEAKGITNAVLFPFQVLPTCVTTTKQQLKYRNRGAKAPIQKTVEISHAVEIIVIAYLSAN